MKREKFVNVRMSEEEVKRLDYITSGMRIDYSIFERSDAIRKLIELEYMKRKMQEYQEQCPDNPELWIF